MYASDGTTVAAGGPPSWLCGGTRERARMLDMEARIRPMRAMTMLALALGLAACGPWIGYWTILPLACAAACFVIADRLSTRTRYPEYAMMAAWLISQLAIGAGVALTGGPESPALPLMAVPIVSLSARFSLRGVVAGVGATLLIMAAATLAVDPQGLADDPTLTTLSAAVVICVGALSTALMRSDLQHRSETVLDTLTGMLNRRALESRLPELEEQSKLVGEPIGLIVADVDCFKAVNDEHGHARGDAVLTDVSYVMRKQLRAFDLAYRIGGEEFVVLLPGVEPGHAELVAERLRREVAETAHGGGLEVTMSFGVAGSANGHAFDYEREFAAADAALLEAKRDGRNRVRSASAVALLATG